MTAGLTSRPIAGPKSPFAPQAAVAALGALLVAGAIAGAAIGLKGPVAQTAADSSLGSQALIQFRADERASYASAASASDVAKAFIQFRADERASYASAAIGSSRVSRAPMSERDSLRLEHRPGYGGAAWPRYGLQHGPLE
jgi:hypothetical protein